MAALLSLLTYFTLSSLLHFHSFIFHWIDLFVLFLLWTKTPWRDFSTPYYHYWIQLGTFSHTALEPITSNTSCFYVTVVLRDHLQATGVIGHVAFCRQTINLKAVNVNASLDRYPSLSLAYRCARGAFDAAFKSLLLEITVKWPQMLL